MSARFQETEKWCLGRRGEILADIVLSHFGFTLLDASDTGRGHATKLHRYKLDLVAPDYLGVMTQPLWIEVKTKKETLDWSGGGRRDGSSDHMPYGPAHGINAVAYHRYRAVQQATKINVVLLVIAVDRGEMLANTLDALGEPYPSENKDWPMVNWPASRFDRLFTFNQTALLGYFYQKNGSFRTPPAVMPEPAQRDVIFDFVQPVQQELEGFRQILFDYINQTWVARDMTTVTA